MKFTFAHALEFNINFVSLAHSHTCIWMNVNKTFNIRNSDANDITKLLELVLK